MVDATLIYWPFSRKDEHVSAELCYGTVLHVKKNLHERKIKQLGPQMIKFIELPCLSSQYIFTD